MTMSSSAAVEEEEEEEEAPPKLPLNHQSQSEITPVRSQWKICIDCHLEKKFIDYELDKYS